MKTFVYTIISNQTWKIEAATQEEADEAVDGFASKVDEAIATELLTDDAVVAVNIANPPDVEWEYLFEYEDTRECRI